MFLPIHVEPTEDVELERDSAPVVYALLLACLLVHLGLVLRLDSEAALEDVFYGFGLNRFDFRPWGLLTCAFLHGGWLHLASNGYFLWIYGCHLERLMGSLRFLCLYIAGAFLSDFLHLATVSRFWADIPCVGASGAISAVLGAFLVLQPRARLRCLFFSLVSFRPILIHVPAWIILGMWFIGQLIYSLNLLGPMEGVAFWAHLGGFAAGAGLGSLLYGRQQRRAREAELERNRPLREAWAAVAAADLDQAGARLDALDLAPSDQARGTPRLAAGVLAARGLQDGDAAMTHLELAFHQAADYGDRAKMVTAYLQMLACFDPADIPAVLHRDAGHAASASGLPHLALVAFSHAVRQGLDDGLTRVLDTAEAVVGVKLRLQTHLAELQALRKEAGL